MPQGLEEFDGRNVLYVNDKYGREEKRGNSYTNKNEAEVISCLVRRLLNKGLKIGVISAYKAQISTIVHHCKEKMKNSDRR